MECLRYALEWITTIGLIVNIVRFAGYYHPHFFKQFTSTLYIKLYKNIILVITIYIKKITFLSGFLHFLYKQIVNKYRHLKNVLDLKYWCVLNQSEILVMFR